MAEYQRYLRRLRPQIRYFLQQPLYSECNPLHGKLHAETDLLKDTVAETDGQQSDHRFF